MFAQFLGIPLVHLQLHSSDQHWHKLAATTCLLQTTTAWTLVLALHYTLHLMGVYGDACRQDLWAAQRDRHVILDAHANARKGPEGLGLVGNVQAGLDGEDNTLLHWLVMGDAAGVVSVHAQPMPCTRHTVPVEPLTHLHFESIASLAPI